MRIIEQVRGDIRQRRNVDIYVTIVAAVVVSLLSFFDVVPPDKAVPTVLAVLAIVALNILATRAVVEAGQQDSERFSSAFPADMIAKRESAKDVFLIGVSLSRTIDSSYGAFQQNLDRGSRLRILLTDPDADDAALDARGEITRPAIRDIKNEIERSLRQLAKLHRATTGDLEVRLTRTALKFGMQLVEAGSSAADMHVQLYSYRLAGESRPMFTLTHADGQWFDCFATQANALWADATPVDLDAVR